MEKSSALREFELGMVVGNSGWTEYFKNCPSPEIFLHLYDLQRLVQKRKYPISVNSLGENALLMPDENGPTA